MADWPLRDAYFGARRSGYDISEHLPVLVRLAKSCRHVTEMGFGRGVSTTALVFARPARLISYDLSSREHVRQHLDHIERWAAEVGTKFTYVVQDVLEAEIEPTDLLFIDTYHTADQLRKELARHADKVSKYLVFHDTVTYGLEGEHGHPGLLVAVDEFLAEHPEWREVERYLNNNGLLVLKRDPK